MAYDLTPTELEALRFIVSEVEAGTASADEIHVTFSGDGARIGTGLRGKPAPFTVSTLEALHSDGLISIFKRSKNHYMFSLRAKANGALERAVVEEARALRDEVLRALYAEAKASTKPRVEPPSIARRVGAPLEEVEDALRYWEQEGLVSITGEFEVLYVHFEPEGLSYVEDAIRRRGTGASSQGPPDASHPFIAPEKIDQLKRVRSEEYDLARLVQLCEELNAAAEARLYIAMVALQRTILHHVPPIFGHEEFKQVVAHAKGRSFKLHMRHLEGELKNVADHALHMQVGRRSSRVEPQETGFQTSMNALIEEAISRLK